MSVGELILQLVLVAVLSMAIAVPGAYFFTWVEYRIANRRREKKRDIARILEANRRALFTEWDREFAELSDQVGSTT